MKKMDPDNWKLTAYALGELDDQDRAEVEALLAESKDACKALEDIRRVAGMLSQDLQAEPAPQLTDEQRKQIETRLASVSHQAPQPTTRMLSLRRWRAPVALAASLALVVTAGWLLVPSLQKARESTRRI